MQVPRRFPFFARLLGAALIVALAACTDAPSPVAPLQATPEALPLIVPTVQQVLQVSTGDYHTCVVKPAGDLACWGGDSYGQASSAPAGVFTQVSAGYRHTCALRADGTVACWGNDDDGALLVPGGVFTQVSAGEQFACAVRPAGTLACWGRNFDGRATPPSGTFTQVAAGDLHACAIATGGSLACWGDNFSDQTTPPAGTFVQLVSGGSHSCGLKSDGTIVCWGYDGDGRLAAPPGAFVRLGGGHAVQHHCALRANGNLECWGQNNDGESTPPSGAFTDVSDGGYHSCAVRSDGSMTCWGANGDGQSTLPAIHVAPTATFAATPASVPGGGSFTIALTNAQVPGHPEATAFTYAFDCGDGAGYGLTTPNASANCTGGTPGAQTVRGKVIDQDGDLAEYSADVNVTQVAQVIAFTSQPPVPALLKGTYAASATGGASANPVVFSSLTSSVCTVSGSTVSLNAIGTCKVAANQAGNAAYTPAPQVTQTFAVVYAFPGFSQPVDNLPTVNSAKAGQTIPLVFRVQDAAGAPVLNLTTATVTVTALSCSIGSTVDLLEEYAAGGSGLQNLGNGYYQFNWKTPKTYANSCKTMQLDLGDGITHTAAFQFK